MNGKFISSFFILSCFILAAFSSAAETCGQLAAVKGPDVEILRLQSGQGETVRYALRIQENKVTPVECDDVIIAGPGSSARVILGETKLALAPDSRISLAEHVSGQTAGAPPHVSLVDLVYGKLRALVNRSAKAEKNGQTLPPNAAFRVRTYSAVAGVRGTDFFTSYNPNTGLTEQATIVGSVGVRQAGTSQEVTVSGGHQVSVETTPAAVTAAAERLKAGADKETLQAPEEAPQGEIKPLEVIPIQESVRNEIRLTSAIARDDRDFAHAKAVEILGKPETWTPAAEKAHEKIPDKLKGIKNEF